MPVMWSFIHVNQLLMHFNDGNRSPNTIDEVYL